MVRIIVTGSRDWVCEVCGTREIEDELDAIVDGLSHQGADLSAGVTIVQGGSGNVDDAAAEWALGCCYGSETHRAKWGELGKKAGPIRNQEMVDAGAALGVAFWDGKSRGTLDCITRAVKASIPVQIVPPTPTPRGEEKRCTE